MIILFIKAVGKDMRIINNTNTSVSIGGTVNGHCVMDSPNTICGFPKFENPLELIFLEVEPEGQHDFYKVPYEPTYIFESEMRIIRSISLDELKSMDSFFKERCEHYEKELQNGQISKVSRPDNNFQKFLKSFTRKKTES